MRIPNRETSGSATLLRFAALGIVLATVAAAVTTTTEKTVPGPVSLLERGGRSTDLLCQLAALQGGPPPKRESKMAPACPNTGPDSSARVVPVGDDRRRSLVLRAGDRLEAEIAPGGAQILRFWVATRGLGDELEVRISLGTGADAAVWERRLATHDRWVDGEIAVPPNAGPKLRFTVETSAPRPRDRDARLALAAPRLIRAPAKDEGGARNILLYVIDTLRADHTPMYGYERNTMPRLAAVAQQGVVFDRAYSTAARTRPATASALTGLYPSRHHARLGMGIEFDEETLAETLRDAGWSTWAYVTNGNVFAPRYAFEQGFDRFHTIRGVRLDNHARTGEINERMLPMLREYADEPFFLYVHAIDPHSPYDPPAGFAGRYRDPSYSGPVTPAGTKSAILAQTVETDADTAHVRDLYDEDILYQDSMFGDLLDALDEVGVLDETLIVVVADHGDEFREHGGWEHGNRLFEEQIRIPFVMSLPNREGREGRRIKQLVSLADVPQTVLGLYGLDAPPGVQGRDLSAAVMRTAALADQPLYSEEITQIPGGDIRTLIDGRWKLIRRANQIRDDDATKYSLYDLEADPGEFADLGPLETNRVEQMRVELLRQSLAIGTPRKQDDEKTPAELDERTRRQLRALGYAE
ncbi:MAG: sulfatase [Candidatus Binatia bacterium]|nr:sulfatase [Candidatus Binatia bacterium]